MSDKKDVLNTLLAFRQQQREFADHNGYIFDLYGRRREFSFPPRPRDWMGKCSKGHTVKGHATRAELEAGDLTAFCTVCDAYVLPVWDLPPEIKYVTPKYSTELRPIEEDKPE